MVELGSPRVMTASSATFMLAMFRPRAVRHARTRRSSTVYDRGRLKQVAGGSAISRALGVNLQLGDQDVGGLAGYRNVPSTAVMVL